MLHKSIAILGAILMAVTIFPPAGPVEALSAKSMIRVNGTTAVAEWFTGEPTDFSDTFIAVDQTKTDTLLFVGRCSGDMTVEFGVTCSSGQMTLPSGAFSVDRKLNRATLGATDIELWNGDYSSSQTVTVASDWTGTSTLQRGRLNVHFMDGTFMENYRERVSYRDAAATGSFDGLDLGTSSFGQLIKYSSADMFLAR